ncbi:type VI secretion system contractile sheath small subunit [Agrobacterium pusense]|uniref:type VI secretion system contractile sheath small subunit n=1 Tax=Agrobacterium pusense TaxID=648995 RepID=UPI0028B042EE|nr:type VI secretion system contractile sheath small subunit [Agrobacterium pusense]
MSKSGQKFVARNRAPRVQIEYDVEVYGAEKSVQLPFVMGVMADLSGNSADPLPAVADRKFLEIDVDNFDERMKAIRPRAAFHVPNMLTGEGNLSIDLTFERLEDFSPAAIAKNVEPLRKLLEARTKLSHLVTYMDGKTGAEDLIAKLISDPATLAALTGLSGPSDNPSEDRLTALESLRAAVATTEEPSGRDDVDAILNSLRATPVAEATDESAAIASVLSRVKPDTADGAEALEPVEHDDLDALLSELGDDIPEISDAEPDNDIYTLLQDLEAGDDDSLAEPGDDLDALLGGLDAEARDEEEAIKTDTDDALSSLLAGLGDDETEEPTDIEQPTAILSPFGTLTVERPAELDLPRSKFRIALLGDFSGRAARGIIEIGDDLAARKPIRFDVDSIDAVIARFATTLVLPIGADGAGVEVTLRTLDDLHPDALYDNVALFEELAGLRQRVAQGDPRAMAELQGFAGIHADFTPSSHKRAKGSAVPADRKLGDFRSLIGDSEGRLVQASPASELIARIVGPYVHAAREPAGDTMLAAIDAALSGAMRAILHHPDFQAVEATWRSLELLARQIETGPNLEIVLYDVSAEEWAADLSARNDLSESGLFRMLAEEPRLDDRQGPLSAVFGLYTLEESPPHAELLARMSKISAWMNAPFVAAISPQFLETRKHDRHPLVARTWDDLRALPEAAHVGLVSPRFLLRLPYGRRTEPVEPFDFEEFTLRSGLKGMLWANPVILSAILMAATVTRMGKTMRLGEIMSLGDIPMHVMTDQHGDQIALPCTERLLDTRGAAEVVARGFMPVLSVKGRTEIRQGSFQSLGGAMLAGPWAGTPTRAARMDDTIISFAAAPLAATAGSEPATGSNVGAQPDSNLDLELDLDTGTASDDGTNLDDLLAQFSEESGGSTDAELDPELAALLESL